MWKTFKKLGYPQIKCGLLMADFRCGIEFSTNSSWKTLYLFVDKKISTFLRVFCVKLNE